LEKNNAAMLAWTVRDAYNPLATDLLRAVEVFADDSTFKARVIDSCTEAVAAVMKRPPELNGFTKAGTPPDPNASNGDGSGSGRWRAARSGPERQIRLMTNSHKS
jgi:hypothetical protein